jgi:hypothetical protein
MGDPVTEQRISKSINTVQYYFIFSAALILLVTSIAKLFTAFNPPGVVGILDIKDPVLGIKNRDLMFCAGLLELVVTLVLFFGKKNLPKLILITWLGTNFALYRLMFLLAAPGKPCPCLGNFADVVHIDRSDLHAILTFFTGYFLLGGISMLFLEWRKGMRSIR